MKTTFVTISLLLFSTGAFAQDTNIRAINFTPVLKSQPFSLTRATDRLQLAQQCGQQNNYCHSGHPPCCAGYTCKATGSSGSICESNKP